MLFIDDFVHILSRSENNEQVILHHIHPHVSALDVENYVTFLPLDIDICLTFDICPTIVPLQVR